ncbi:MAG: hypothetical protein K9I82_18595 [Chitinophagaceae bacterium]|nr:hypothetical protein [Chitinophagaceae bacterium]
MKTYNVLWIDDKFKEMRDFQVLAENHSILLEGYKSKEEAFDVLENGRKIFDAILLDGIFFEKKNQETGTENVVALGMAIQRINELKSSRIYPWFVLSGQDQFIKTEDSLLIANKKRSYDKTNPKCFVDLFNAIKEESDAMPETKIKHNYYKAFDLCTDDYIGEECASKLLFLLTGVEDKTKNHNTEDKLNAIRKIIENIFNKFYQIGIIPAEIARGNGSMNKSGDFLAGLNRQYKYNEHILHPVISHQLISILDLTQDGSHLKGDLKLGVDDFIKTQNTPYLFNSIIFQLLDIMIWCKNYFDNHQDSTYNNKITELLEIDSTSYYEGLIEQDNKGNFYCGEYALAYLHIINNNFKIGDRIKITESMENTNNKTNLLYPKHAKKFIQL